MWRLLFSGNDGDFDFFKSGLFEPAVKIALGETEPAVPVKVMGLLKRMTREIKNHDLAVSLQDSMDGRN